VFVFSGLQLSEMNGKMVSGKPLYVALAQHKEDRRARLQVFIFIRACSIYLDHSTIIKICFSFVMTD
jgi:hypothetical protein